MTRRAELFVRVFPIVLNRVCVIGVAGLLVALAFWLYTQIDGWLFYRTFAEVVFSISDLVVLTAAAGIVAGAMLAALLSLALALFCPDAYADHAIKRISLVLIAVAVFGAASIFEFNLAAWFEHLTAESLTRTGRYLSWLVFALAGVAALSFRSVRRDAIEMSSRLYASNTTRRNLVLLGGAGLVSSAVARVSGPFAAKRIATGAARAAAPDILLITFDALGARDMSLYGYRLPTTPNIDRFAANATVFTNYYATSTFTTPSVVSFMSGRYPSSTHVFQLEGRLHGGDTGRTLPAVLKSAGYETGASAGNIAAHPVLCGIAGYDVAPAPPTHDIVGPAAYRLDPHGYLTFDATALRNYALYFDWRMQRMFDRNPGIHALSRPEESFAQAETIWRGLRGPKFLHVHVLAPHLPYDPSPPFRGKFGTRGPHLDFGYQDIVSPLTARYPAKYQPLIDHVRLWYDEWVAQADAAFGQFMDRLEAGGALANTIVALSADHGESFEGGMYGHGTTTMMKQVINVPLILRRPGQKQGARFAGTADAVSLAPTLLDLAGVAVPAWMEGRSLKPQLGGAANVEGLAFAEVFDRNSAFEPLTKGTVGVIDGEHQYIVDVATGRGSLYDLSNAYLHSMELSAQKPDVALHMRRHITTRFPAITLPA